MNRPILLVTALAYGCASPEKMAGDAALSYTTAGFENQSAAYDLACPDEKAAKSREEFTGAVEAARSLLGAKWDEAVEAAKRTQWSVKATALNDERTEATVELLARVPQDDGSFKESTSTVQVRKEGEAWCVITGWAEQARLDGIAKEGDALMTKADGELEEWSINEAEATISAAKAKLAELPVEYSGRSLLESGIDLRSQLLDSMKDGWVGGRWRVTEEVDPMTDQRNVTASLRSVTGLPNVIGTEKRASLIFRCNRGKLDGFVATDSMLDSDWRYDTVTGQHRFGSAPATKLVGSVSTDRQALFLRNPTAWIQEFKAHEAESWTVELPLYNRMPASVRFDLASAGVALSKIPEDCR